MLHANFKIIGLLVLEKKNGHIYVYSPGAGADNPLGTFFCQKHEFSIKLDIYCKFFPN